MEIRKDYYPDEIAGALCRLADKDFEEYDEYGQENPIMKSAEEALYQLMAVCENKYNSDYYRDLWDVLQNLTENFQVEEYEKEYKKQNKKREFIAAYTYEYGMTVEQAENTWHKATPDYVIAVVDGYRNQCRKAFYND